MIIIEYWLIISISFATVYHYKYLSRAIKLFENYIAETNSKVNEDYYPGLLKLVFFVLCTISWPFLILEIISSGDKYTNTLVNSLIEHYKI